MNSLYTCKKNILLCTAAAIGQTWFDIIIWIKVHVLLFKYACLNLTSSIKAPNLWAPLERAQVMANVKKIEIYNVDFKLKAPKVPNINLLPY